MNMNVYPLNSPYEVKGGTEGLINFSGKSIYLMSISLIQVLAPAHKAVPRENLPKEPNGKFRTRYSIQEALLYSSFSFI